MNYILALIISATVIIFGLIWLNESQATKIKAEAQAQATIIQANAQANATMTQANAALLVASVPIVLVGTGGLALALAAVALLVFAVRWQPRRVIEQRVIFQLVEPGVPRRELWQMLAGAQAELLERKDDTKSLVVIK